MLTKYQDRLLSPSLVNIRDDHVPARSDERGQRVDRWLRRRYWCEPEHHQFGESIDVSGYYRAGDPVEYASSEGIPTIRLFRLWLDNTLQIGPSKWIPAQVFVFGLIATLQVLLKNRGGFLATRMLLGLAEAGYIPGSIYTLSTWYTPQELGRRVAILFFGMFGGNAISPLIGAGILRLHGRGNLSGWQYIFLSMT